MCATDLVIPSGVLLHPAPAPACAGRNTFLERGSGHFPMDTCFAVKILGVIQDII